MEQSEETEQLISSPAEAVKGSEREAKRQDIQGLRAVAITLVLAFHFMPQRFPNGYLGVDMFFVLSGYLMGMVLSSESRIDTKVARDFYFRRMKRIVPTFYLVAILSLIAMIFVLSVAYIPDNSDSAVASLTFHMNRQQVLRTDNYFLMEQSNDLFKHCWSLSVEIQFYLVVPLIFVLQKNILKGGKLHSVILLGLFAVASWTYHFSLKSLPVEQFNSSLGRGWQFLFGIIAFLLSPSKQKDASTKGRSCFQVLFHLLHVIFAIVIVFGFYPEIAPMIQARTLCTLLTALYLVIGSCSQTIFLSNSFFSYVGDLSYSLYLTHWPILMLVQYSAQWHNVPLAYANCFALVLTICSAVLVHHFFEKVHLKWEKATNLRLILVLFVTSITLAYGAALLSTPFLGPRITGIKANLSSELKYIGSGPNADSVRANMALAHPVYYPEKAIYEDFAGVKKALGTFPTGNDTLKVLVMGNSYALQHVQCIEKVLAGRHKSLNSLAILSNQVITNEKMPEFAEINRLAVERLQPHVLIIATRLIPFQKTRVLANDSQIREGVRIMKNFSAHTDHILLGSPMPTYPRFFLHTFVDRLQRNLSVSDMQLKLETACSETAEAWKRTRAILGSCPKCSIVNHFEWFADNDNNRMLLFDPVERLSYLENTMHFTDEGLRRMESLYKVLLEPIIRNHNSRGRRQTIN